MPNHAEIGRHFLHKPCSPCAYFSWRTPVFTPCSGRHFLHKPCSPRAYFSWHTPLFTSSPMFPISSAAAAAIQSVSLAPQAWPGKHLHTIHSRDKSAPPSPSLFITLFLPGENIAVHLCFLPALSQVTYNYLAIY